MKFNDIEVTVPHHFQSSIKAKELRLNIAKCQKFLSYTLCLKKKRHPSYICYNLIRCHPILSILGRNIHSAIGPSLLGVRRLGTHYRTVSVIYRSAAADLGAVWKLYFSRNTSVLSAIEMLHDIALYKFNIHIHIHSRKFGTNTNAQRTTSRFVCSYCTV